MYSKPTRTLATMFLACAAIVLGGAGDFDLTWYTIDGGGGACAGGEFDLAGTIGQPDAGSMSGGEYTLTGGFWAGAAGAEDPVTPCPGDLNGDETIGVADLLVLLACWGDADGECAAADLNSDSSVGVPDLLQLLGAWGTCP